jgi:hypothetical protein
MYNIGYVLKYGGPGLARTLSCLKLPFARARVRAFFFLNYGRSQLNLNRSAGCVKKIFRDYSTMYLGCAEFSVSNTTMHIAAVAY